jgi:hypothetical protein
MRVLPLKRGGKRRTHVTGGEIVLVNLLYLYQMDGESVPPAVGQDRHPVFLPFTVVDLNLPPVEIDVLHPELQRFEQPQSRSIKKGCGKLVRPVQRIQKAADFLAGKDDREFFRAFRFSEIP